MFSCCQGNNDYPDGYSFNFDSRGVKHLTPFPDNSIRTTKYTLATFLPLALLFQFKRLANIYFLIIAVLQSFPVLSPFAAYTAWTPLAVVLGISMAREAF
jgi:hypothetical protein